MINVNNVLKRSSNFQLGISIKDSIDLKFIFESSGMHYIELYVPVVQIKYLQDNLKFFLDVFNLEEDKLRTLINCESYIVVNPKENNEFKKGDVIKKSTYINLINESGIGVVDALSGGEAIKYLIDECATDENRRFLNFLLMDILPIYYVSPKYPNVNLLEYYDAITVCNQRIPKLIEKKAPELILIHEKMMLQKKFNELINVLLDIRFI